MPLDPTRISSEEVLSELNRIKEDLTRKVTGLDLFLKNHRHTGAESRQVDVFDLFGNTPSRVHMDLGTIDTAAGNYDVWLISPITGSFVSIDFCGESNLATSDTNYIQWTINNFGLTGNYNRSVLSAAASNSTKATGGGAITATQRRQLILSETDEQTRVVEGDRLRVRAKVTGTLANTVTFSTYMLRFA